jgi:integrase
MPFALVAPKAGRSPYWRVRGSEFGIALNRSTQTRDKASALKLLRQWQAEAKRQHLAPADDTGGLTFASAALAYIRADGEKRFLEPLLLHFRETPLAKIDQAAIDAAAVTLYPNATPATRDRQVYSPVSAVMRHAGVLKPLRRPKGAHAGRRLDWLRPEEAFALLEAAKAVHERFGALLVFLTYTGVRLSEALRLEWKDVDLGRAVALIRQTKNGEPLTVHLPPEITDVLASLTRDKARVFCLTKSGRLYHLFAESEKRAGLSLPPRAAFHILRHTHATWRRLYAGADTSALVETGLWRSRTAASRYEHFDVSEEARKSNMLPTPDRVKPVRAVK